MRSNFLLTIEDTTSSQTISLHCCLRQANKAFENLAFALSGNQKGYQKLSLSVVTSAGSSVVNVARFNGVKGV